MDALKFLEILNKDIHSVVVATVGSDGLPSTRVIDIMLSDEVGLYFLTARGKAFYKQLMDKPYISLSGMSGGKDSMSRAAITISGAVRCIGIERLEEIFSKNPYMAEIYPTRDSRSALEVFCLYKGQGEFFDLSTKPITREAFAFGEKELEQYGYLITDSCNGCGMCVEKCPQDCIDAGAPYFINQEHCLHCGNCYEICHQDAVIRPVSS